MGSPGFFVDAFGGAIEFSQNMCIAEAVRIGIIVVGRAEVGDECFGELRKGVNSGCVSHPTLFVKSQELRLELVAM